MSQITRALVLIFVFLAAIPARAEPTAQNADLAQALAARMPHTRVEVFEGIGHLPHLEAPERFNELLLRFLDEAE